MRSAAQRPKALRVAGERRRARGRRWCSAPGTCPAPAARRPPSSAGMPVIASAPCGGAVVGDRARDDLGLGRLAGQLEVLLRQLPRALDRLAAAGGEEDPVEVAGREVREALGEVDRRRVRVRPEREEGEVAGLLRRRLGQLVPPVAGLDDEQPGEPVEVAPAAVVPDVGPLAAHDDRDLVALAVRRLAGEVLPQVLAGGEAAVGAARRRGGAGGLGDFLGRAGHAVLLAVLGGRRSLRWSGWGPGPMVIGCPSRSAAGAA